MRPNGVARARTRRRKRRFPARSCRRSKAASTNWPPPAFSPDTGLFYVQEHNGFNMLYLTDPDPRGSMGLGGKMPSASDRRGNFLDGDRLPRPARRRGGTRVRRWRRRRRAPRRRPAACCSPATAAATSSRSMRRTASRCGTRASATSSNAPQTYIIDGRQHVLVAVGDTLYAFAMY